MQTQHTFSNAVSAASYESRNFGWMKNRWIEDRLNQLAPLGRNKAGLAKKLGLAPARVTEIISGDRLVKVAELEPLSDYLEMPMANVLTGLGATSTKFIDMSALVPVEVVGFVQAGLFREAIDLPHEDRFTVTIDSIPGAKNMFGLQIRGDSMNREFKHGDVVICQSLYDYPGALENDLFVVVEQRRHELIEATVKQLAIQDGKYWLHPRSTNPAFSTAIQIPPPEQWGEDETNEIRVIGVVLRAIQNKLPQA